MALLTDRKFIHFNKKSDFEAQLNANAISDKQIVFLKDAQEIWTHGTYYGSVEQFLDETNKDSTNAISAAAVYKALTDDEKTIAAALNDLNDKYTNLDSSKQDIISDLDTIRENAQLGASKVSNVQSDWNATTGDAVVLNKPNIKVDSIDSEGVNISNSQIISREGHVWITDSRNSINLNQSGDGGISIVANDGSDGTILLQASSDITLATTGTNKAYYNNKEIATVDQIITPPVTSVNNQTGDVEINIPSKVSDLTDDLSLATQGYVDDKLDDVLGVSAAGVEAFVNMTRDEDTATGILTEIANKALKTNAVNGAPLSNTESYFYGTSTTAAATAQKEVSIPSITSLKTGQIIVVKPTITSTVANSTIKLNNFTAYPMRYNNAAITISTNSVVWNASFPSIWVFDGNYWVFLGHGFDNNTTYYAMSQGEATTGTATTARIISAKVLNDTIEGHTKLSSSYQPSSLENDDLILDGGDTYETAFGKLEKSINDNEQITAAALTDLDSRINTLHLPQSLDDIPDGSTRKLSNYATTTQLATKQDTLISGTNIKTINNQSLLGTGNINVSNIEIIEVNANIRADVTKDGTITVDDTTEITRNITSSTNNLQYDVNNDGNVTIADVSLSSNIALNKPHNLYIDIETNPYSLITTSFNNSKIPILRLVFPGNQIKDILIQKTNNTPVYYGEDIYAIQIPSSGNGINLSETIQKIFVQISETEANGIIGHIVTKEGLATKQDALVSGTNIKTINNQSILGSGNITISGGSGDTNVIETVKVNGTALTPDANKAVDIPIDVVVVNWYDKFADKSYFNMEDGDTGSLTANEISELASLIQANDKYVIIRGATSPGDYIYYKFAYDTGEFWDFVSHALGAKYTLRVDYGGNNTWTFRKRVEGIINGVKVNGTELTPDNSNKVNISVPSAVTESTVLGWGFTKNTGTVTGVKMNGTTNNPTNGVVDLGTVLTSFTETDPTVPAWAKASSKPTYTAAEVGALPDTYTPPVTSVNGQTGAINLTIPSAPGTLNTTATAAQSISSSEALSGNITLHKVAKTGTYNDLIGKPTIPAAQVQSDWNATSGMGVILNKPTIPTVNNATLTIQKNGTSVGTFTANASSNVTANIQVNELPTVSSSDNGKILQVVNGAWALVTPTSIYSGTSEPDSNTGNNGDLYLQTS